MSNSRVEAGKWRSQPTNNKSPATAGLLRSNHLPCVVDRTRQCSQHIANDSQTSYDAECFVPMPQDFEPRVASGSCERRFFTTRMLQADGD